MDNLVVGIATDWLRPDGSSGYGAIGWYRQKNPLEKLGYKVYGDEIRLGSPQLALDLRDKGEIWFFKPVDNTGMNEDIERARKFTGAKLVIDIDDEPFDINPTHPMFKELTEKSPRVKVMLGLADHIVVSTPELKESLKAFRKPITVIPNAIDPKIWKVKKKKRDDGKIRIGWIGSASHFSDTQVVNEAFDEILKKYPQVELHLCGFAQNASSRGDREFHHKGTNGYKEYPQFLADLDLDIAVAPLIDSKFNRCKSNIKWMEHAMLETPMVLSDITPYSDCVKNYKTGYLAKNKNQWVKYLGWLVESAEKRKEIGQAAKKEVLDKFTIDKQLPKYQELFEKLRKKDITVYTANIGGFDKLQEDQITEGANFIAFTDQLSDTWEIRKTYDKFKEDRRNSRIQKIMPHLFFDTKYSIYLDGNIKLKVPAQQLIDEFLKDKDVAVFRHLGRDCVYVEATACMALGKGNRNEIMDQISDYSQRGWKEHAGLVECGMIIRRHTPEVERMNEKWWAHYCRYSERDQISFPLAFPLDKVEQIESSAWRHPWFEMFGHINEKDNYIKKQTL